jgi:RNase P/RNase MRP subunit p30
MQKSFTSLKWTNLIKKKYFLDGKYISLAQNIHVNIEISLARTLQNALRSRPA